MVAVAEAIIRVAGREGHLAARRRNRSAPDVGVDGTPERHRDVAEPGLPAIPGFRRVNRNDGFDLVAGPEATLVDQLIADGRFRAASDRVGQDHFVLRERLLREDGARKVQIAPRPRAL